MKGTSSGSLPFCAKCKLPMTPENSKLRPELFLCDACLPVELKPNDLGMKPEVSAADFAYPRCAGCKEVIAANEHNVINDRGRFHVKCAPSPQWSDAGKKVETFMEEVGESLGIVPPTRKVFETIHGLTLDVRGEEIFRHCQTKAGHYSMLVLADQKLKRENEEKRKKGEWPDVGFFNAYMGPSPVARLKFFEFVCTHVNPTSTYQLSMKELEDLEWFH